MALKFNDAHGSAKKSDVEYYKFTDGDNVFRMVGDILPRYVYWLKSNTGNNIPVECLRFDREEERFTNLEKDWVQHYFPDQKCSWAYAVNVIDPEDGKGKVLALKKKMFEQIRIAADDLGDPTDPDTGCAIHVKRVKTGPLNFNVEYQVRTLKLKPTPLTEEERELAVNMKPIDEALPRPTPEEQKSFIEKFILVSEDDYTDREAVEELSGDTDE